MKAFAALPPLALVLVSLCGHYVPLPPAEVSGLVFFDANRNGLHDTCDFEGANLPVVIVDEDGGRHRSRSDDDGAFVVPDVPLGAAFLTMDTTPAAPWPMSTRAADGRFGVTIDVRAKGVAGVELGVTAISPVESGMIEVGGVVFDDRDGDGEIGRDECGMNPGGEVMFSNPAASTQILPGGRYSARLVDAPDRVFVRLIGGCSQASCRTLLPTAGEDPCSEGVRPVPLVGSRIFEANVGYREGAYEGSVSGVTFSDLDRDGQRDDGEPARPEMTVQLYPISPSRTCYYSYLEPVVTGEDGTFRFERVPPGSYSLTLNPQYPEPFSEVSSDVTTPREVVVGRDAVAGIEIAVQPPPNGYVEVMSFRDDDGDGVRDSGEEPFEGLNVCVYRGTTDRQPGSVIQEGQTGGWHSGCDYGQGFSVPDRSGNSRVGPLPPGEYTLVIHTNRWPTIASLDLRPLYVTLGEDEVATLDVPVRMLPIEEQLLDESQASPLPIEHCYSDPAWVRPAFEDGYDASAGLFSAWQLDETDAREIYSRRVFLADRSVRMYVWFKIGGLELPRTIECANTPDSAASYATHRAIVLVGYEPVRAFAAEGVVQVTVRESAGVHIISLPSEPFSSLTTIFVDEAGRPIARCGGSECE